MRSAPKTPPPQDSIAVMNISDLLPPDRVVTGSHLKSKKRVLEQLSELLARGQDGLDTGTVFNSLLARERLGATALGHGVALPHGRMAGVTHCLAAFVGLEQGIDFDAPDHQPVDLIFALVVPDRAEQEHLQLLAQLARHCSDPEHRQLLRRQSEPEGIIRHLVMWNR